MSKDKESNQNKNESPEDIKEICGVIMPISDTDGYRPKHWQDVAEIIHSVIQDAGFQGKIVSDSKVSNIIHNEIVQNIAENPIIICDVSSKNPNVMFELGLRLAFDKPTIVIKDDETNYNFDTSPIRHLQYPKDLRHSEILSFKSELKEMLIATYEAFKEGKYVTFLQSFTKYKPKLQEKEVGFEELMNKRFDDLSLLLQKRGGPTENVGFKPNDDKTKLSLYKMGDWFVKNYLDKNVIDRNAFHKLPFDEKANILKGSSDYQSYFKDISSSDQNIALVYGLTYYAAKEKPQENIKK